MASGRVKGHSYWSVIIDECINRPLDDLTSIVHEFLEVLAEIDCRVLGIGAGAAKLDQRPRARLVQPASNNPELVTNLHLGQRLLQTEPFGSRPPDSQSAIDRRTKSSGVPVGRGVEIYLDRVHRIAEVLDGTRDAVANGLTVGCGRSQRASSIRDLVRTGAELGPEVDGVVGKALSEFVEPFANQLDLSGDAFSQVVI